MSRWATYIFSSASWAPWSAGLQWKLKKTEMSTDRGLCPYFKDVPPVSRSPATHPHRFENSPRHGDVRETAGQRLNSAEMSTVWLTEFIERNTSRGAIFVFHCLLMFSVRSSPMHKIEWEFKVIQPAELRLLRLLATPRPKFCCGIGYQPIFEKT